MKFAWMLDEKVILLVGSIIFVLLSIWMIHMKTDPQIVGVVIGIAVSLAGALTRGIVGSPSNGNGAVTPDKPTVTGGTK